MNVNEDSLFLSPLIYSFTTLQVATFLFFLLQQSTNVKDLSIKYQRQFN